MNDLLLHIDLEYIVGVIKLADNNFKIVAHNDKMFWLYFYCDQINQEIDYSKSYKKYYLNKKANYFGNFTQIILNPEIKFIKNSTTYHTLELLLYSNIIRDIIDSYKTSTDTTDIAKTKIPLHISFSDNISTRAQEMISDYLKEQMFEIVCNRHSLSEILLSYVYNTRILSKYDNVIVIDALNDNLNLTLLKREENKVHKISYISYPELGSDPRIRAIVKYVVDQVNSVTGLLKSDEDKEAEYKRQLQNGEEWIRRLNVSSSNIPLNINDIKFLITKDKNYSCIVNSSKIDECTGDYVRNLFDIFKHFLSTNKLVKTSIDGVIFFGDSLNNNLIKELFYRNIDEEKIVMINSSSIYDVLRYYFKLDSIHDNAFAKIIKLDIDSEKRKQDEEYYTGRKKENSLVEASKIRDKLEQEIKIKAEIEILIREAERYYEEKQYKQSLLKYECVRNLDPTNTFINAKINDINRMIIEREILTDKYHIIIEKADALFNEKQYELSLVQYQGALTFMPDESYPKSKINEIKKIQTYNSLIKEADILFGKKEYNDAENKYDAAIKIMPNEHYAHNKKQIILRTKLSKKEIHENPSSNKITDDFLSKDSNKKKDLKNIKNSNNKSNEEFLRKRTNIKDDFFNDKEEFLKPDNKRPKSLTNKNKKNPPANDDISKWDF